MPETILNFKPYGLITAHSPEELAKKGIIMYPFALPEDWGPDAPQRYWNALGFSKLPDPMPTQQAVVDPSA